MRRSRLATSIRRRTATWESEMDQPKHRITKGDWIIRAPDSPPNYSTEEQAKATFISKMIGFELPDFTSFSEYAVHVLDATQSHLTVFDPMAGRVHILVYDRFPGVWHYATEQQVSATWSLAANARHGAGMQIDLEKKNFLWRPQERR